MIDLILFACLAGTFYGGFKAGNRFKTMREFGQHIASRIKGA